MSSVSDPSGYNARLNYALQAVARGWSERTFTARLRQQYGPISNLGARAYYQTARQALTAGRAAQGQLERGVPVSVTGPLLPTLRHGEFEVEVIISVIRSDGSTGTLRPLYVTLIGEIDSSAIGRAVEQAVSEQETDYPDRDTIETWEWRISSMLGGSGESV